MIHFVIPLAFGLATLLPVIVALYFLKLRREEHIVSSTYLWQELVRDTAANAPWQRLRFNWLMLLQLLILISMIFALARPFTWTTTASGGHLILVMDTSASMSATDVAPNRLSAAADQARRLVRNLASDVPLTLIIAGSQVEVILSESTDRAQLNRTLSDLKAENGEADMTTALELAAAIAGRDPEAQIIVLSDGGGRLPEWLASSALVRYLPVGTSGENQAISALSLDATPAGESPSAFVRVTNYGSQDVKRRLTLYTNGILVAARDLALPAGESIALTLADLPAGTTVIEAKLDGNDPLLLDDQAWAVLPLLTGAQIQIVGPGNRFLELGLALLPGVQVATLSLEDYEATWAQVEQDAAPAMDANWLTIFDTVLPDDNHYPPGALLFTGPLRSTKFFSVTGSIATIALAPANTSDPLLAYVDLRDVLVQRAARVPIPDWGRSVIVTDGAGEDSGAPMLIVGGTEERRLAVLTFDLRDSDLPLRVAYPLLLSNLLAYLAPGAAGPLPITLSPGQPLAIPLPPHAEAAIVTRPDGTTVRLPAAQSAGQDPVFSATGAPGVYEIAMESDGEIWPTGQVAVNLFNSSESDVAPRQSLVLTSSGGYTVTAEHPTREEWWQKLAWLVLALLITEWLVQYRNNLAQLFAPSGPSKRVLFTAAPERRQ